MTDKEESLGKLERVELRKAWLGEATDFTPWLADNLELLGETIGIEMELEQQEKDVGPYRADILCRDTIDESWILIENQIEKTDHTHLGQLLTYAAGLEAATIIWIAKNFTDEHRAALDWLNEITDERFRFFGLEVELWKISQSPPAPKFNIVSKPNNWTRSVRAAHSGELSKTQKLQQRYWTKLVEYMEGQSLNLGNRSPRPANHHHFSSGRTGFRLYASINTKESGYKEDAVGIDVNLHVRAPDEAKAFFCLLQIQSADIEAEFGRKLEWDESRRIISCTNKKVIPDDEGDWENQHRWLAETLDKFAEVLRPRIRNLDASEWVEGENLDDGGDG